LLGSAVKLVNLLYRFARHDPESGRAARALRVKDAFSLAYCRGGFRIAGFYLLRIPHNPLVTAPGHDP
jgi:hypothetical protein